MTQLFPYLALFTQGGGGGGAAPGLLGSPLVLVLIIGIMFYFLLYKPEKKRKQERENMLKGLQRGDEVITAGGIYGKITAITDTTVTVEVANNTKLKLGRQFISSVVNRDKQAAPEKPDKSEKSDKDADQGQPKRLNGKKKGK